MAKRNFSTENRLFFALHTGFDRFVEERNRREERALARRYVPDDMIGYADLDDYGRWSNDPQYGALWYPRVAAGWAPYRDGRWIWVLDRGRVVERAPDGTPLRMVGTHLDITERMLAQEAVRAARRGPDSALDEILSLIAAYRTVSR